MLPVVLAAAVLLSAPPTTRTLSFPDDNARTYDALLSIPAERNGVGVLLIGGSLVTDQHWTVPASVEENGTVARFTIDGKDTRDADTVAASLADAGFVVLQWSSIHRDDALHKKNLAMAEPIPYLRTVALTRLAVKLLREQPEVDPKRIALIGHSLGATRAWQIADDGVIAIVSLAGAYVSRVREAPRALAAEIWETAASADADEDGALSEPEFAAWRATDAGRLLAKTDFAPLDADKDGLARPWELAAASRLARLDSGDTSALDTAPLFRDELPWPIDRAEAMRLPRLALFGGLDTISIHGPLIEHWKAQKHMTGVTVEYFPSLNHQMAPAHGDLTGPIDHVAVRRLTTWLRERAAQ